MLNDRSPSFSIPWFFLYLFYSHIILANILSKSIDIHTLIIAFIFKYTFVKIVLALLDAHHFWENITFYIFGIFF